ncbi:MAG TPA: VCBS repeat-containing protein [Ohtaekwangia sp.]
MKLFDKLSSSETGIRFVNTVENTEDFNVFGYRNFYNGGGVSIGDINNDGLPDIYFTSNLGKNKLYLNKGNFEFEDISTSAGVEGTKAWSTGVVMADINADGLLDIYVCNAGYLNGDDRENELFINNGDLTFTEQATAYNLNENGYTTHAAFFDYDLDGDLDAYILNNSFIPVNTLNYSNKREVYAKDWPVKDFLKGGGDKLLRNDNGKYVDVTETSGVYGSLIGFGLGITIGDVNNDRLPDMFVSNDFFERDYLYINQGNGKFSEELESWMQHTSLQSMGADMADINNDGYPEIFVTEMLPDTDFRLKTTTLFEDYKVYNYKLQQGFYHQYMQNTLQLNNGNKSFSEIAWYAGVAASDWSWGALMFDADNDRYKDIYVCNGIYHDETNQDFMNFFANDVIQKMALTGKKADLDMIIAQMPSSPQNNKFFHNNKDLTFTDSGIENGFDTPSFSNGSAYGDLDNDGDLDLVINNVNQEAFVYRNNANSISGNHYLKVSLKGKDKNTFAVGSKITAWCGKENINFELIPTRGFQSSIDYNLVFGLGESRSIDSLMIQWPDKSLTVMKNVKADTLLYIDQNNSNTVIPDYPQKAPATLLTENSTEFVRHQEDGFVDFYQEGLVMRKLSNEGPRTAVGDVNHDGFEDVFICGASGQSGQLYLQTKKGFTLSAAPFKNDLRYEDTAAEFFDADQDGDLDLIIGSGGNHQPRESEVMQNRIYVNDGQGNFKLKIDALPLSGFNTGIIVPWDIDHDNDLDLFIGSRSVPGIYGVSPRSFLLENDGRGKFTDISAGSPHLKDLGLITDASLIHIAGSTDPELVIIGEWMSPVIFEVKDKKLVEVKSNLRDFSGWWYAIASDDFDGDDDQDLVLGNRGENFCFTASAEQPAKLWLNDFDNNGMIEKIITRSIDGRDMPVPLKGELTQQIPGLKKKNLKFSEYASKSIQDLFTPDIISRTEVKQANWFKSIIAINLGNGSFKIESLPGEVQFSCVNAIQLADLNGDEKNDLILGGNFSGFTPQFSKLDAAYGHVLLSNGNGSFARIESTESGFFVKGDIMDLVLVAGHRSQQLLVALNNQKPRMFDLKNNN